MSFPEATKSGGHMMRKNVLVIFGTALAVGMLLAGCSNFILNRTVSSFFIRMQRLLLNILGGIF